MRRKIYERLLQWKNNDAPDTAILIDGARRVGKSYVAEQFAKAEYKSYVLIDFNIAPREVKAIFDEYLDDLDEFFKKISSYYAVTLYVGETLFIFDEVQECPEIVTFIKFLGDDETVIYRNFKGHCRLAFHKRGQDLMATVGRVVSEYRKIVRDHPDYYGKVYVNIDDTGLGGGVTDRLREVKKEQRLNRMMIIPINAAEHIETDTPQGKESASRYHNLTTDMWATIRDLLDNKAICIEDDDETVAQLSCRKYQMTSSGKLELESKKEMKKRGLDSPDRGDALALSCYTGKIKKYTGTAPGQDFDTQLRKENYFSSTRG